MSHSECDSVSESTKRSQHPPTGVYRMLFTPTPAALPQTRIDSYGSEGLASREPLYQCGCGSYSVCLLDQDCRGSSAGGRMWVRRFLCQDCGDRTTQTWVTSAVQAAAVPPPLPVESPAPVSLFPTTARSLATALGTLLKQYAIQISNLAA